LPGAGFDRRSLLLGAAAAGMPIMAGGCSRRRPPDPRPGPEVAVLTAAMAGEDYLISLYDAVRGAHSGLSGRLDPLVAHHRDHLSALRMHYRPGRGDAARPVPAGSAPASAQPPVPAGPAQALERLRLAERQAAAARIRDVERVGPAFAQLLASIGACEAGHAAALAKRR
jgi:hypothetical protein